MLALMSDTRVLYDADDADAAGGPEKLNVGFFSYANAPKIAFLLPGDRIIFFEAEATLKLHN